MRIGKATGRLAAAAATGLLWLAPLPGAAEAPVTECDRLAADPEDPQRPAGVEGAWWPGGGDYLAAIAACEEAVARYPDEPRFRYQRARVILLWSRDCRPDRVERFGERDCLGGSLGPRLPGWELMPLALANARKLEKFGA